MYSELSICGQITQEMLVKTMSDQEPLIWLSPPSDLEQQLWLSQDTSESNPVVDLGFF